MPRKPKSANGPLEETPIPRLVIGKPSPLVHTLQTIGDLVAAHPQAAALMLRLIVDEGKSSIRHPEGRELLQQLRGEAWVEKGRILWEACGLDALMAQQQSNPMEEPLITRFLREIRPQLEHESIEDALSQLMLGRKTPPHE